MLGLTLALCAGFCAALASSFAKFAMSPEILRHLVCDNTFLQSMVKGITQDAYCQWVGKFLYSFNKLLCRVPSTIQTGKLDMKYGDLFELILCNLLNGVHRVFRFNCRFDANLILYNFTDLYNRSIARLIPSVILFALLNFSISLSKIQLRANWG